MSQAGPSFLLDSVIVIDHLNGVEAATEFLLRVGDVAAISAITRAEVLCGYPAGADAPVRALLDRFPLLPIDGPVADLSARLRRRHGWKLPDALQAASALLSQRRLATRNTRDFDPEQHDFVVVPYRQ